MAGLADFDLLFVDCQTTGSTPALGSVLELGFGVVRAGASQLEQLQSHWVALPEGTRVSATVRRLTGYNTTEQALALPADDVWQRLRTLMGQNSRMRTAIHFAQFELLFLRDWARRFEPEREFPFDAVCLHAIACRLYPELPRRSLRALAGFLGYSLDLTRRARGHVEASAFIWQKLQAELLQQGVGDWAELAAWLNTPRPKRPLKRRFPLTSARYRSLPDVPGVYRFLRSNGDLLYIGKAASLKKRVASHFSGQKSKTERALEMLTQVYDVQVTVLPSALEAALLENAAIKAESPPYNVQLLAAETRVWFMDEALDSTATQADPEHPLGPLPSAFVVRALGAITRLAAGAEYSLRWGALALAVKERWAAPEAIFAAGFTEFLHRHLVPLQALDISERRRVYVAAKRLLPTWKELADSDTAAEAAEMALETPAEEWDAARVTRHLERNIVAAYQLLRRARWLYWLSRSLVQFHEPGASTARLLRIENGNIVAAEAVALDAAVPNLPPFVRALDSAQSSARRPHFSGFDRHRYDRLRILTTELKRILRDGGSAQVRLGRGRLLSAQLLQAWLSWV